MPVSPAPPTRSKTEESKATELKSKDLEIAQLRLQLEAKNTTPKNNKRKSTTSASQGVTKAEVKAVIAEELKAHRAKLTPGVTEAALKTALEKASTKKSSTSTPPTPPTSASINTTAADRLVANLLSRNGTQSNQMYEVAMRLAEKPGAEHTSVLKTGLEVLGCTLDALVRCCKTELSVDTELSNAVGLKSGPRMEIKAAWLAKREENELLGK